MNINDTYNHLKTLNLTTSQRHFSLHFLSKSASYLSMLNATSRQPSCNTLIHLAKRLSDIADNDHPLAQHLLDLSSEVLKEALNKIYGTRQKGA